MPSLRNVAVGDVGVSPAIQIFRMLRDLPGIAIIMDKATKYFVIAACSVVILLGGIPILLIAVRGTAALFLRGACMIEKQFFKPGANLPLMNYVEFEQAVSLSRISKVLISPHRGNAVVTSTDGFRYLVILAPDRDLLRLLTDHNVDISVEPTKLCM